MLLSLMEGGIGHRKEDQHTSAARAAASLHASATLMAAAAFAAAAFAGFSGTSAS